MIWYRRFQATAAVLALSAPLLAQAAVEVASNASVGTTGQKRPDPQSSVQTGTYVIGVDDVLAISVWKEPELSRTLPVRPDGKITLPLVGDLQAAGTTTQNLQQELHDKLAAYMAVPEVAVIVQEVKSQKYNIVGQVVKPG